MAGSRIRGITIEIDGNFTKLQRALSGVDKSLKETQTKLKDVDKLLKLDPKNVELLTQKQKALNDAVELTKVRLDALKEAQEGVAEGSAEWDTLQREIIATEQDLKGLEQQSRDFGSVGAQQIAAVGAAMQELGGKIQEAGQKFAPVSAAAAGLAASLVGIAYGSVTAADDLNTLSKQTGLSTDALQKMKYASDLVDVSVEDITGAVSKMKKAMGSSPDAFDALGVSVTNADGSMRDAEDVFYDTLEALSKIENETERDQAAYAVFGKSADQLAGIVDDGGAALKAYGDEAEELGLIMSGDTLDALNEVNDEIDRNKAQISAATSELGATITQALLPLIGYITAGIQKVTEFMQALTPEQARLVLGILAVVAAIAPLLTFIGSIISAIGTIMTLAPAIGAALTALTGPIGLIIAAVAVLVVGIITHWDEIKAATEEFVANLKASWDSFKQKLAETWENIKTAVSNAVDAVKTTIETLKTNVINVATNIVTAVKTKFEAVKNAIVNPINTAKTLVQNAINKIKSLFSGAKFEFPKIKLPHFSWEWNDIGGIVKIPKITVDWYKKAYNTPYLFDSPTVMQTSAGLKGFGDGNGGEIVYGRDQLLRDIASAGITKEDIYQAFSAAIREMDTSIVLNNREVGRMLREQRAMA